MAGSVRSRLPWGVVFCFLSVPAASSAQGLGVAGSQGAQAAQGPAEELVSSHDDGLRVGTLERSVSGTSRFFLSNTFLWGEDVQAESPPPDSALLPWLETVTASFVDTDAYSSSSGYARQHSLGVDLGETLVPDLGAGAMFAVRAEVAVAESTSPSFNWTSEAEADSTFRTTVQLDRPYRYALTGRLIARPDPTPSEGGAAIPDGVVVAGQLVLLLDGPAGPVERHELDMARGAAVLDVQVEGVLGPGVYTLTTRGEMQNSESFGYRFGRASGSLGAFLDLSPLAEPVDVAARRQWLDEAGWSLPDPPAAECPSPLLPAVSTGFEFDVASQERQVTSRSTVLEGARTLHTEEESAEGVTALTLNGTVSASCGLPTVAPFTSTSFAHQTSSLLDPGVLTASGIAAAESLRHPRVPDAVTGSADAVSSYVVEFGSSGTSLEIEGRVEAVSPDAAGHARVEVVRIDPSGEVLDTPFAIQLDDSLAGPACQEFLQTLVLAPGRYRLTAEAVATRVPDATGVSEARFGYAVELRASP